MDLNAWKFWVDLFQTVITFGLGIWLYLDRRNDKTQARITELTEHVDERLDNHSGRLSQVEADMRHMPTHADLGQLHEKVNAVAISNSRIEGVLQQMVVAVDNMRNYLMSNRNV